MHYYFIESGKRYLYDTVCGGICEVSRLQKEMLPYVQKLERPIPDVCPTALRYSLAKYEVSAINEAYDSLLDMIRSGLITIDDEGRAADTAYVRFDRETLTLAVRAAKTAVNCMPTVETVATVSVDGTLRDEFAGIITESFSFITVK
jgi:hypothetical protein